MELNSIYDLQFISCQKRDGISQATIETKLLCCLLDSWVKITLNIRYPIEAAIFGSFVQKVTCHNLQFLSIGLPLRYGFANYNSRLIE